MILLCEPLLAEALGPASGASQASPVLAAADAEGPSAMESHIEAAPWVKLWGCGAACSGCGPASCARALAATPLLPTAAPGTAGGGGGGGKSAEDGGGGGSAAADCERTPAASHNEKGSPSTAETKSMASPDVAASPLERKMSAAALRTMPSWKPVSF